MVAWAVAWAMAWAVGKGKKSNLKKKEWPPGSMPGGHNFVLLNVSINKMPVFVSAVVINNFQIM